MSVQSLLVVCTGNICRSPFAMEYFRQHLPVTVESAGTGAPLHRPADMVVQQIARLEGLDLSEHLSRPLTDELLLGSELILVMEHEHGQFIQQMRPEVTGRTMLLGHWSGQRELPDPHKQSPEMYEAVFSQLKQDLVLWTRKLDTK